MSQTMMRPSKGMGWPAVRFSSRKLALAAVTAAAVLIPVGQAWGCVALVAFRVNGTGVVQPGGTLEVFGGAYAAGEPVDIRLDSPDGPVLATVADPQPSTMTSKFTVPVPIPADIAPGQHFLVATQGHFDMNVGNTARAAFYVGTSAPAEPLPSPRPTSLAVADGPSVATFVLIGLGVAAGGLLLAGVASALAARRPAPSRGQGAKAP